MKDTDNRSEAGFEDTDKISATVFLREPADLRGEALGTILINSDEDLLDDLAFSLDVNEKGSLLVRGRDFQIIMMQAECRAPESIWWAYAEKDAILLPGGADHVRDHRAHVMCQLEAASVSGKIDGSMALSRLIAALEPVAVLWEPSYLLTAGDRFVDLLKMRKQKVLPFLVWLKFQIRPSKSKQDEDGIRISTIGLSGYTGYELRMPWHAAPDLSQAYAAACLMLSDLMTAPERVQDGSTIGVSGVPEFTITYKDIIAGRPLYSLDEITGARTERPLAAEPRHEVKKGVVKKKSSKNMQFVILCVVVGVLLLLYAP